MSKKSIPFYKSDYFDPARWVPTAFIEKVIQGFRTIGSESEVFFQFTDDNCNNTSHREPSITENTDKIYYTIPGDISLLAGTKFIEILRKRLQEDTFNPKEKLPNCFYEALSFNAFREVIHFETDSRSGNGKVNERVASEIESLKAKTPKLQFRKFGDLPKDVIEMARDNRLDAIETVMHSDNTNKKTFADIEAIGISARQKKQLMLNGVKGRTATVCSYLPEKRPITLVMPLIFGRNSRHYHTFVARITEDSAELLAVATKRNYPDYDVLNAMEAAIKDTLGIKKVDKNRFYQEQGDACSCGPQSASVSISIDSHKTLADQEDHIRQVIKAYRYNKPGVKRALARVYNSLNGLRLQDDYKIDSKNNDHFKKTADSDIDIAQELKKYISHFNEVRPCAFGVRMHKGDQFRVFAVRILEDKCEIAAFTTPFDDHKKIRLNTANHIIHALMKVLDKPAEFFENPKFYTIQNGSDFVKKDQVSKLVAHQIDPNLPLSDQAEQLIERVFGNREITPILKHRKCETTYSFASPPLSDVQVLAKRDEWQEKLNIEREKGIKNIRLPLQKSRIKEKITSSELSRRSGEITFDTLEKPERESYTWEQILDKFNEEFEQTKTDLPLIERFENAIEAVPENNTEAAYKAFQYAAVDLFKCLYLQQQEQKSHHLKVAIALTIVGLLLPVISHIVIWTVYAALHRNDIVKLVIEKDDRAKLEAFRNSKLEDGHPPVFNLNNRIHFPQGSPIHRRSEHAKPTFTNLYDEEDRTKRVNIYMPNPERAKHFQREFKQWESEQEQATLVVK